MVRSVLLLDDLDPTFAELMEIRKAKTSPINVQQVIDLWHDNNQNVSRPELRVVATLTDAALLQVLPMAFNSGGYSVHGLGATEGYVHWNIDVARGSLLFGILLSTGALPNLHIMRLRKATRLAPEKARHKLRESAGIGTAFVTGKASSVIQVTEEFSAWRAAMEQRYRPLAR